MAKVAQRESAFAEIAADYVVSSTPDLERIYHYTSSEALLSIISSRELWLLEHSYLSDYSEVAHGLKAVVAALEKRKGVQLIDLFYGSQTQLQKLAALTNLSYQAFIFSMTEDSDSKSQWSEYGNNYKGICIGFDYKALLTELLEHEYKVNYKSENLSLDYVERPVFAKVIYSDEEKEQLIEQMLDKAIEIANGLPKSLIKDDRVAKLRAIITDAHYVLIKLISLFKDKNFEAEQEHRIVVQYPVRACKEILTNLAAVDYRIHKSLIVPFHRFRLDNFTKLVASIGVGPKYGDFKYALTLSEFCHKNGIKNVAIDKSTLPIQ